MTQAVDPLPSAPIAAAPPPAAAPLKPPALSTRNLTKRSGTLTALDQLTLDLEAGDSFGFIGPNGAGKSTTMKILAGLLEPTSGKASVLGKPVERNGDFGRRIVGDVLELTDLKFKQDAFVDSLSRGMTQRLSLARVLVHDPPILLLDEPASGLDPRARIEIRELLKELRGLGKTILVSSHILSELGEFCNKLGIIERGKLIVAGTVDELMQQARAQTVIAVQVVGDPSAAIAALKGDRRIDQVELQGMELMVTMVDAKEHHHFIIERLVGAGVQVHSVAPHQLKL